MIVDIGNIIISKIDTLPFMDKYAGITRVLSYREGKSKGAVKTFPASVNTTIEQCEGRYTDLLPDSSKKSVLFLEDRGTRLLRKEGKRMYFTGSVNLVCWLNLPALGFEGVSYSSLAVASIIAKFPESPFNSGIYNMINIEVVGQEPKSTNPFQRYTIEEATQQFLMYPYDYFSLAIDVEFMITKDCINILEEAAAKACVTK